MAKTKKGKTMKDDGALTITPDNRPSYLPENVKVDTLGIGQDDIILPRIQLVSSQSEVRTKHKNCESDQFWHTGEEISIGKEFLFIVVTFKKSLVLMRPQGDKNDHLPNVLAFSDDLISWNVAGEWEVFPDKDRPTASTMWTIPSNRNVKDSGLDQWGSAIPDAPGSPPAATLSYRYLCLPVGEHDMLGPSIFTISRTSIKYAKKLNSRLQRFAGQGTPATAVVIKGMAEVESNKKHTYNVWGFAAERYAQEGEYENAEKIKVLSDRVADVIAEDSDVFETFIEEGQISDKIPF